MKKNDILAVLIKKTPRGDSPKQELVDYFNDVFKEKNYLYYISRLSANITVDSEKLHKMWDLETDKSPENFKKFVQGILEKQKENKDKYTPKLFQILDKNQTRIIETEKADQEIGELSNNQAVWPYIFSFRNYDLISKNKLLGLKNFADFVAPEMTKWLKRNFLGINNLNVYGAVHFNTNHPHIQFWISEKRPTKKHDKTVRFDKRDKFDIKRRDLELELEIKLLQGAQVKSDRKLDRQDQKELEQKILNLQGSKKEYISKLKKFDFAEIKNSREMKIAESLIENQKDLYAAVQKARDAKRLTSLMLSTSDMIDIIEKITRTEQDVLFKENSSKYYKFLNPGQKQIIDNIYKKVLKSDRILLDKKNNFDKALDEVRKFETNYNDAIAHKAKSTVKKEENELFLASRNFILKQVRKFYGLDSKQRIRRAKRTTRKPEYKFDPKIIYAFKKWKYKLNKVMK
ncbi:hypothetical protein [Mesomycoplasma ovipneumoniae]|uniref:hypothetical protein n=1 Tax=Mesomycoplasma ovipneumoniae TaxID=29562 RepID=UPI0028AC3B7C|nr:hypothetical protein [Mesomycoplasma ovipneumoniae]MDW2910176.1 hypothetical protein [Mesomycoplasma ovipneumoniae]MDW2910398.1 hypothetical protein [Mesomycoplasma ovipneumoniae]MDW2917475.1 hypothetical protein [Mesomycoplasma ovipneumoniae]WNM17513.1 hypothetical protein RNM28_00980 [Mesomycoplasma ovipneumoniae]